MPTQGWMSSLVSQSTDGTAVTGTSEGSLLHSSAKILIPGGSQFYAGQGLHIKMLGRMSNIVTTPGTLTFKVKMGPSSSIIAATSQAIALNTTAKANVTFVLDWELVLRGPGGGTTATFMHAGTFTSESNIGSGVAGTNPIGAITIPASAPAVGTGWDSTVDNVLDVTATFSLTGNSIQSHIYRLESLN